MELKIVMSSAYITSLLTLVQCSQIESQPNLDPQPHGTRCRTNMRFFGDRTGKNLVLKMTTWSCAAEDDTARYEFY